MKKRILSLFLTVLMLMTMLPVFPLVVNAAPTVSYVYSPALLIGGEKEYNIVWKTNVNSIGYVTYTYNGKTYTAYDENDGVVVSDEYVHSVKVPMEHLNAAGKYTAHSAAVDSRTGYAIKTGTVVSKEGKVKWANKTDNIKIGCFSDIHLYDGSGRQATLTRSVYSLNNYMKGVDIITLNGDVSSIMTTESYLDLLLATFEQMGADGTPILYTAGNHECRGITAQRLPKYFGFTETEDLYGRIKFGPVEFLVTFSGEDKIDEHQEYGDLNDMEHYKAEQYDWFYNCGGFSDDSKYRISISHSHNLVDVYFKDEFMSKVNEYSPDIHINGHTHAQRIDKVAGYDFPFLHDGGHDDNTTMRTTLVTITNGQYKITGFNDGGSVVMEDSTPVKNYKKGSSAQSAPVEQPEEKVEVSEKAEVIKGEAVTESPSLPTAAGVQISTLKSASNTTAITVKPTVFEGGKYYNVVWQTTPDIDAAGEVIVSIDNSKYRFKDQIIGKIRTDTTHSVRIPKETFGNAKYEAKSRVVLHYTYGGYVTSPPTSYGAYVSAGTVNFKGDANPKQAKFSFVAVSGIKTQAHAEKVKAEIGNKTPDMLITLGNMVNSLDTEKDFGNYLKVTQAITGGKYPVMFLRGENETKGAFAAHIGEYIRNITPENIQGSLYLNTSYDCVSIVGLDTATAAPDTTDTYNGYAGFDYMRQVQLDWLKNTVPSSFKNTYNLVFANADNLINCAGVNFSEGFSHIGTNLSVTGQSGKASLSIGVDSYSKAICGTPDGDGTYGLLITCENNKIAVESLGGDDLGEIDVEESKPSDKPVENQPSTDNPSNNQPGTNNPSTNQPGTTPNTTPGGDTTPDVQQPDNGNVQQTPTYVPGEYDGVEGDLSVRVVKKGWYKDYISKGYASSSSDPKGNGVITEKEFILMVANLSGVNLYMYDAQTDEGRAVLWAKENKIYTNYLGDDPVTETIINTVLNNLFPKTEK